MPAAHNGATPHNSAPGNQLISGPETVHSFSNGKANAKPETGNRDSNEKPLRGPRRDGGKPQVKKAYQNGPEGAGEGAKAAQHGGAPTAAGPGRGRGPKPASQHPGTPSTASGAAPLPATTGHNGQLSNQHSSANSQAPPAHVSSNGNPAAGPRMFQRHMGINNSRGAGNPGRNGGRGDANTSAPQAPAPEGTASGGAVPSNSLPAKSRPPRPPRGSRPESARNSAPGANAGETHTPAGQQGIRSGTAPEPGLHKKQKQGGGGGRQVPGTGAASMSRPPAQVEGAGSQQGGAEQQVQQGATAQAGKQAKAPRPKAPKPRQGAAVVPGELTQPNGGANAGAVRPPPPPPPPRGPPARPDSAGVAAAAGHHAEAQPAGNKGRRPPRSARPRGPADEQGAHPACAAQNGHGNQAGAPSRQHTAPHSVRRADVNDAADIGHDSLPDQHRPRHKQPRQGSGRRFKQGGRDAQGNGVHEQAIANGSVPSSPTSKEGTAKSGTPGAPEHGKNSLTGRAPQAPGTGQVSGPTNMTVNSPRSAMQQQGPVTTAVHSQAAPVTAPAATPAAAVPSPAANAPQPAPAPIPTCTETPLASEPAPPAQPATGGVHNEFAERMAQQALARLAARASMTAAAKTSAPPPPPVPAPAAPPPAAPGSPGANGSVSEGHDHAYPDERPRLRLLPRTQGTAGAGYAPPPPASESSGYSGSYAPPVDGEGSWVAAKQTVPPPASAAAPDAGRPKLQLAPRTKPVEVNGGPAAAKSNPFGAARPREEILKERGVDAALLDLDLGPRQYGSGTRASRAGSVTSGVSGDEHGPGDQWTTVGKQGRPRPKEESTGDFYELDLFGAPMRNPPPPPRFFGGPPPPGPGDYAHFSSSYGSPRSGFGGGFHKGPGSWYGRASDDVNDDAFVVKRALPLRAADV